MGQYEQDITLSGAFVKQPNSSLENLEVIARVKGVVTLAFENGKAFKVVI